MIDKLTTEKIILAAQITDVVSDFVTLKKRGVNYVGLCPFHEDSSPSFYISPSKNICKCFACGEGGTPVHFIMKHEQVSYIEALRYLAKKYSIEIQERELTDEEKRMNSDRESMMVVNSWAQKHFASRLYDHEEGQSIGMRYWIERGFRDDIIRKFQLGYGLDKRDDLFRCALKEGFKEEYLLKTGLVYKRDDGTIADRFHGRVIFPVHTLSGKVVAFGGRIMGKKDKIAKYINSPESEIYHKSNELYGLYHAKQAIVKADKCYLVEGYTDVISMYQGGIENVVASSGTALTHGQIRLVHRFTGNITVIYDGDAAGIKAAVRGIDMLLEAGMNVKIVLLPEGEDPDSFARTHNSFDFTLYIKEHEVDFVRFKINLLLKDADNDPMKRANLIKDVMETVAVIPDNITRSVYIKECSQLLEQREQSLIDEVINIRKRKALAPKTSPSPPPNNTRTAVDSATVATPEANSDVQTPAQAPVVAQTTYRHSPFKKYESALVQYVVRYGERDIFYVNEQNVKVAEYIQSELEVDDMDFQTPVYKQIVDETIAKCRESDFVALSYFLSHADLSISALAAEIVSNRYQLSKYFENRDDSDTTSPNAAIQAEKERLQKEKERKQLADWIVHDLLVLKFAYIQHKIGIINKQIKECQDGEEDKIRTLLLERKELDRFKVLISKELGERIITGGSTV